MIPGPLKHTALALLVLVAGCAQVRDLQGGPKDVTPPELLSASPANGSVHFTGDRIVLHFNERVNLDRVRERLLISPPLERLPDVQVSGGTDVVIQLRSPLLANTTYTFNIGESVVDLTEGNPALGLTYVMSTGDVLDSLAVQGRVVNAFTGEPEAGVLVVLHADTDTAGFRGGRPAYFSRTDKEGGFRVEHLRGGRFALHALRDQNANYRYDLPNEEIAFLPALVVAGDSALHELRLFRERAPAQRVLEAVVQADRCWRLAMARPADTLALVELDHEGGRLSWTPEWNPTRDTVLFWPSDTALLADNRFVAVEDHHVIDTLTYRVLRKMPFYVDLKSAGTTPEGAFRLVASRPIAQVDRERIHLERDSVALPVHLEADTANARVWRLTGVGTRSCLLELMPGALRDIYDAGNDTLRITLGGLADDGTGDLTVRITADSSGGPQGPFILQVINPQGGVVRSAAHKSLPWQASFQPIAAAQYDLKLIQDLDGDGRWSTGDLRAGRQPERVFRQPGGVNVRAGWDVGVDWVVTAP